MAIVSGWFVSNKKRSAAGLLTFAAISVAAAAFGVEGGETAQLRSERDELIGKLASGTDYEASVRRWKELLAEHDKLKSAARLDGAGQEEALKARLQLRAEYQKTADYDVSWRCTFSPDPAHPIASTEGRFRPDWGKVTRRQQLRRPPKNELDEGELVTMFEVKGVAKSYQFAGEHFSHGSHTAPFEAAVGDLVLVCKGGEDERSDSPAGWGPTVVTSGFAVRLTDVPLIAKKAKWAPVHVTGTFFYWAIREVRWKLEHGQFVLSNVEIFRDLGGGHYEIDATQGLSWILEVPPSVKIKEPLVPGRSVWAIMGQHRFDKALKKLVLVAEDLEPRYIAEKR